LPRYSHIDIAAVEKEIKKTIPQKKIKKDSIPLNKKKDINLSFGGEVRPRLEYFNNRNWAEGDDFFYSQRLSLHSNLNITNNIRVFGELYHGLVSLDEEEFANSDKLDWHQGFIALKIHNQKDINVELRFGRQEMALGAARLLGLREGPNMRRAYDMGRAIVHLNDNTINVFYGKEVKPE